MTDLRGATCTVILFCFSLCHSVVIGQTETSDCQIEGIGLINGTFDSATGGWKYNPGGPNKNGYSAEIISDVRASNVLRLTPQLPQAPGNTCMDNRVLWQENIKLGTPRTTQFVLRFDHLVEQARVGSESSLIATFTVNRLNEGGETGDSEIRVVYIASHPFGDEAEWTTSEVYVNTPSGDPEHGFSCDVMFESQNLIIQKQSGDDTCPNEIIYPEIMLDNVEILVMKPGCKGEDIGFTVDGQPTHCAFLNLCGASQNQCTNADFAETPLQGVPSKNTQNPRNFYKYCLVDAMCCGNSLDPSRYYSETSDIKKTESENYYAKGFDQSRYWTLCRSLNHCIGDLDENGIVGGSDLAILLGEWGLDSADTACLSSDLDGDGEVGGSDLAFLLSKWGSCL
ncbi:MAG: hypothetical protein CMJ53_06815 [Planctomycetaceae bacterium]|nr:hypothetical protein [Planctomycetaceae bacterium]